MPLDSKPILLGETASAADSSFVEVWRISLAHSIDILKTVAGTTEDEFLQIGSQLQDFYLRSSDITAMANRLVDSVSGDRVHAVISRLQQMMADMDAYLAGTREQSRQRSNTLSHFLTLLDQLSGPLEGFRKMTKALHMLGISTKIESSRLGEMGTGFRTLAMDVEKLSQMVCEKSADILGHRQALTAMIGNNLQLARDNEAVQDRELRGLLSNTSRTLEELIAVNTRSSFFGARVSSISGEVSGNLGAVVSSMQMHDMTRQQVEHVALALQRLVIDLEQTFEDGDGRDLLQKLAVEAGDVCELQSAQLRYATNELYSAVTSIIENLRDVAAKQSSMATETFATTGGADSSDGSFIDSLRRGLTTVTGVLAVCARSDRELAVTLRRVTETMQEITGFVTDIEVIGSEIDLIALNSQIKAAHTGTEGAALGVLAEAIQRLSVDAVNQTAAVSEILLQINTPTAGLFGEAGEESGQPGARIAIMEGELETLMTELEKMNDNLNAMLSGLSERVGQLTDDIDRTTGAIEVHARVRRMSGEVESALDRVVERARELAPASSEFKENLRHMEQRYTMESERRIHEAIARKQGVQISAADPEVDTSLMAADCVESEFGANVDLF